MTYLRTLFCAGAMMLGVIVPAMAQDAPMEIKGATTVDARQVVDLIGKDDTLVILDNRKVEDFSAGHIEGAVRLIDSDVSAESLAKHVKSKVTPILFYCNGLKCGRAAKAAEKALELGDIEIYYYALGMDEWHKQGLPHVR